MMNNSKLMELSNDQIMEVDGDGIGGAAIGFVGGIGYGLCKGAFKASRTGKIQQFGNKHYIKV